MRSRASSTEDIDGDFVDFPPGVCGGSFDVDGGFVDFPIGVCGGSFDNEAAVGALSIPSSFSSAQVSESTFEGREAETFFEFSDSDALEALFTSGSLEENISMNFSRSHTKPSMLQIQDA